MTGNVRTRRVCAQGAVSARGPITLLRPSAAAWCCRAGPCERCLKAQEVRELEAKRRCYRTLFTREGRRCRQKNNVKVHCNFYGNRLSDRHSTGGVPRYVRS